MLRASPLIYAHRGACLELPENTLESFALGVELGAGAIETDAHMTRDGRIVLAHDPTGARTAGVDRRIRDLTLAELADWDVGAKFFTQDGARVLWDRRFTVPTLDEALAAFPDVVFNVDAKQTEPDMVPALVRVIRAASAEHRVRIASFSARNLRRARALGFRGGLSLHARAAAGLLFVPLVVARRSVIGDAAQIPTRAWGLNLAQARVIERFHALGLRVDYWTIDDPAEARALLALGADGIVTNDPRNVRLEPLTRPDVPGVESLSPSDAAETAPAGQSATPRAS